MDVGKRGSYSDRNKSPEKRSPLSADLRMHSGINQADRGILAQWSAS